MLNVLAQFSYLQVLDVLTTLLFLSKGIGEANPIVRSIVNGVGSPLGGLLAVKAVVLCLAYYCWRKGRQRLLGRVNVIYAGMVVWNLMAIVTGAGLAG